MTTVDIRNKYKSYNLDALLFEVATLNKKYILQKGVNLAINLMCANQALNEKIISELNGHNNETTKFKVLKV